jgi:nitronate monooxygenase
MSALARVLGVRHPLVQAPMAGSQGSRLAIAVGQAGALGSLPGAMLGPEALQIELETLAASGLPSWNLNFFCHRPPVPDAGVEAVWRARLAADYSRFGLDVSAIPAGPGRRPFDAETAAQLLHSQPAVLSFHFGLPDPALLALLRPWARAVIASATTVAEARWLADRGVDAIIAQGLQAGGHRGHFLHGDLDLSGQLPTLELVRAIRAAVPGPIIAAGGICEAADVRAALAAGADGVQVGSAYLACKESSASAVHRQALAAAGQHPDTALTNLFSGRPARGLVNAFMRQHGPMNAAAPAFPLATAAVGPLRAAAEALGQGDYSPLWCGQRLPAQAEPSAAALTRALLSGFEPASPNQPGTPS